MPDKSCGVLACGIPGFIKIGDLNKDMKEMNLGFELNSENFINTKISKIINFQIDKDKYE